MNKYGLCGGHSVGKTSLAKEIVRKFPHYKHQSFAERIYKDLEGKIGYRIDKKPYLEITLAERELVKAYADKMMCERGESYWVKQLDFECPTIISDVRYLREFRHLRSKGFTLVGIGDKCPQEYEIPKIWDSLDAYLPPYPPMFLVVETMGLNNHVEKL